jgi:two-component system sensor histidine kinase AlgZ
MSAALARLKPYQGSIVRATWWAMFAPRRLLPLFAMSVPLVYAQAHFSLDARSIPIAVLMCLAFVAFAPVSYRVLFPEGLDFSHGAVRLVLYAAIGAGVVLSVLVALPRVLGITHMFLGDRSSLAVCIALFLVGGWGLGRDIGYERSVQRLTRAAEEAQLLALRAHLDPHFLFNTLNAIAEWCRTDGAVAERAVLQLSAILRAVLEGVHENRWAIERELTLVRQFFELHRMRDTGLFSVSESVTAHGQVPPMVLLALAENAVKHGPAAGHRGEIKLSIEPEDGGVRITLENPGAYGGPREGSAGLPTLRRRLELAYEGRARFEIKVAGENRTRAELWLPTGETT